MMMCDWCKEQAAAGVTPHDDCKGSCTCQHGRPYEMSPTEHGFAGYLDAVPANHPAREEFRKRTGHDISQQPQ